MKASFVDTGSIVVIATTFVVFLVALFTKGLTHDLLLEIGVFLVSVKLIIMTYKNGVHADKLEKDIKEIKELIMQK
ncbi:hypothetical protein BMS3Bbin14_02299 [bacterium BMS3Bbin14]|nr:hypothetical protein BMS3Abin13_02213 [bacterium BMS3Abin13]GBE53797.1 hypothetical protein BMS3Bbin14_02299 [bacterium BMS3Bbin14]HDK44378.1 hypothetical protein [Desulfobacteraceae bacterium]